MLPKRISPQANLFALLHISPYTHTEAPPLDFHRNISPNLPSIIIQEKRERRSTQIGKSNIKIGKGSSRNRHKSPRAPLLRSLSSSFYNWSYPSDLSQYTRRTETSLRTPQKRILSSRWFQQPRSQATVPGRCRRPPLRNWTPPSQLFAIANLRHEMDRL